MYLKERRWVGQERGGAELRAAETKDDQISRWRSLNQMVEAKVMVVDYSGTNDKAHMRSYIYLAEVSLKIAAGNNFPPVFTSHQTKESNVSLKFHIPNPIEGMGDSIKTEGWARMSWD